MAVLELPVHIDGFECVEDIANAVLDYSYKGRTLKEWADSISNPVTNGDRLRAKSDQELAEIFARGECGYCRIHDFCAAQENGLNCEASWLAWLRQEAPAIIPAEEGET